MNDQHEANVHDGSDELSEAQGHGYEYDVVVGGAYTWTVGEGDHTLEVVFANCQDFTQTYPYNGVQTSFAPLPYLVPENCGGDVARYSLTDIAAGEVVGLGATPSRTESERSPLIPTLPWMGGTPCAFQRRPVSTPTRTRRCNFRLRVQDLRHLPCSVALLARRRFE